MTPLHRPPDCVHATRANCGPLQEAKGRRAGPPWVPQREATSTSPTTWWFRHGRPQGELGEPKHVTHRGRAVLAVATVTSSVSLGQRRQFGRPEEVLQRPEGFGTDRRREQHFPTSRKDLSKEIRCPACCSTQCFNTL